MKKEIDPLASTRALDVQTRAEWQKKYSPKALETFMKPAEICTLCGEKMHIKPGTGEEYVLSAWERKWSVHKICSDNAMDQLDRNGHLGAQA